MRLSPPCRQRARRGRKRSSRRTSTSEYVSVHVSGFDGATGWINSEPLTTADLRGNVLLVQFWTYTCINWLRTEPYIRAWWDAYRDDGLIVVGVHTPEFPFEQDLDNVGRAVKQM